MTLSERRSNKLPLVGENLTKVRKRKEGYIMVVIVVAIGSVENVKNSENPDGA